MDDYYVAHGEAATKALLAQPAPVIQIRAAVPTESPQSRRTSPRMPGLGEPVLLYGRTRQQPIFHYTRLPERRYIRTITSGEEIGAARQLILARLARFADDAGVVIPDQWYRGEDGQPRAYAGQRGIADWLGGMSHTTIHHHLAALERGGVIRREHQAGRARHADIIMIRPWYWTRWGTGRLRIERDDLIEIPNDARPDALLRLSEGLGVFQRSPSDSWTLAGRTFQHRLAVREALHDTEIQCLVHRAVIDSFPVGHMVLDLGQPRDPVPCVAIPDGLVRARIISDMAVIVYAYLAFTAGGRGPGPLTLDQVARANGISSGDGVRRYIRELERNELIAVLPARKPGARRYVSLMHSWMTPESMRYIASDARDLRSERRRYAPRPWADEIGMDDGDDESGCPSTESVSPLTT
ncbi:MAG: hypothetical protein U0353_30860 [Sandaracinus sp.]